jgi:hypothetical protein
MSKGTPKKFYSASEESYSSACRLCLKICDVTHIKKLFRPANANILKLAEDCLGEFLVRDKNLPQNICNPCERRLTNYKAFKELIWKSQDALKSQSKAKRCPSRRLLHCLQERGLNKQLPQHDGPFYFLQTKIR